MLEALIDPEAFPFTSSELRAGRRRRISIRGSAAFLPRSLSNVEQADAHERGMEHRGQLLHSRQATIVASRF
jgi:hypothetical protein